MYTIQATLIDTIEDKHPANGEDRSAKKFLGMLTEIAECANESRCFKFWSDNQKASKELLEEYVDGVHWLLEHGIIHEKYITENYTLINEKEDISEQFIGVFDLALQFWKFPSFEHYSALFAAYLGLGNLLGFSTDQIETAYFEKNEINMNRQENGY